MTIEDYKYQLECIDKAYVRLRTELDGKFLAESDNKFNPGDVVEVETITEKIQVIVDEVTVLTDDSGEPDVYVTKARYAYAQNQLFPYRFRCSEAKKI